MATAIAVVVLKHEPGEREESFRVPGFELRHEPERRRLVLHRNGTDVGQFNADHVECWHVERG
jgi:hypothetical protein